MLGALVWQAGGRNAHKHKTFQVGGRFRDGGSVGFSGQHGEIGRSSYLGLARKAGIDARGGDDALLELLTKDVPSFLRRPHRDRAREAIRGVIREADRYGLTGLRRWDFFNLFEDTRRRGAAAQAAKPGFSITPFLNPGFIRASFGHPDEDKTDNPFHRFIVASLRPSWSDIPYADELAKAVRPAQPADADAPARPRWQTPGRRRFYDTALYWEDVAQPILADALAQDGFWTEVFDPALARRSWREEPDELAVVCLLPEALAIAGRDADAEVAQRQPVQA